MANIPLQSITFPGLSDKYTTPTVDATLTQTGAAADAKKTGDEISGLKNDLTQGTFPVGNAENASQLTSTVGIEDKTPYLFRTSGGSVDIGDRETVNKIVGGTIVNNQLVENGNFENASGWSYSNCDIAVANNELTMTTTGANLAGLIYRSGNFPVGHKMFVALLAKGTVPKMRVRYPFQSATINITETYTSYAFVGAVTATEEISATRFSVQSVQDTLEAGKTLSLKYVMCTDLTQDFGTSIADYVYSLETATAGAGVAWLKKHFPAQFNSGYQAYDAGSLQSVSGLTMHRMVGFNQWDEEVERGYFNGGTGELLNVDGYIRTKNFVPCLPNTAYYFNVPTSYTGTNRIGFFDADKNYLGLSTYTTFEKKVHTTPSNAYYLKFFLQSTTYNNDICINLHWDGEKDGEYEPYKTWSYALDDSVVIRGIPKVDANGNLYYDGDEYLPDGTVNRRFGIVDMRTLGWVKGNRNNADTGNIFYCAFQSAKKASFVVCTKFTLANPYQATWENLSVNTMEIDTGNFVAVCSTEETVADFKTAVTGVPMLYELATPTTETALPYQATQIVDDWGTEEYVLADGAYPVPVGHDTMYQNNLRAKLEMSPDSPDGDGLYVVQQESGENTYVPLASTTTIQDILTRLTALENA